MILKMLVIEVKKQRYRTIKAVPFLLTYFNACCGFLSILCAVQGHYSMAGWFIGCAVLCDMFDGRLARALGTSSFLGAELDSLADGVSFCCAPSILLYTVYQDNASVILVASLLLFLCAGLFRLARFNVHPPRQESIFVGLPTPMAALIISFLVIQTHSFFCKNSLTLPNCYSIALLVLGLAVLMISTIPFPTCKTAIISKQSLTLIVNLCIGSILVWQLGCNGILVCPLGYVVGACSMWLTRLMFHYIKDIL